MRKRFLLLDGQSFNMFSVVKVTRAEAVRITPAGVRIRLHLDNAPSDYFKQWFRNPKNYTATTRFHPNICSFPPWPETGNYIIIEVPEDAAEDAVRMVKDWVPLANGYAEKKNATDEKRRHTVEMHRKAAEEEQKKRLDAMNAKLAALSKKLNR
jgi:hypothetical protein